jgi:hypothetical protein
MNSGGKIPPVSKLFSNKLLDTQFARFRIQTNSNEIKVIQTKSNQKKSIPATLTEIIRKYT